MPEDCPQCDANFLVRAGSAKSPLMRCLTEGCGFERIAGDGADGDAEDESSSPAAAS